MLQQISKRLAYISLWLARTFPEMSKVALQLVPMHTTQEGSGRRSLHNKPIAPRQI